LQEKTNVNTKTQKITKMSRNTRFSNFVS